MRPRVAEAIVVEGRYDKNTLSRLVDAVIVETRGFGVFSDAELVSLIRTLARARGVVILTDSDSAGFLIRGHLKGRLAGENVKHAYIPDIVGKEKRKRTPSKEGKLGVEGVPGEILLDALRRAGATFENEDAAPRGGGITKTDFYELGLTGRPDSSKRRAELLKKLGFPARMTANALLDAVNALMDREELEGLIEACPQR